MIISARVEKYLPNNVSTDYDDGSFEWFDTTVLTILEPIEFKNRALHIDHNWPCEENSVWRNTDEILVFELDSSDLTTPTQLFSDGIKIINIKR